MMPGMCNKVLTILNQISRRINMSQFEKTKSDGCDCPMCRATRKLGFVQALIWVKKMMDRNVHLSTEYDVYYAVTAEIQDV